MTTASPEKHAPLEKHDSLTHIERDAERNPSGMLDLTQPNVSGKVLNPLLGVSREQLLRDVDEFMAEKHIDAADRAYFHKGALVAQNPGKYAELEDLSDEDRAMLQREISHK